MNCLIVKNYSLNPESPVRVLRAKFFSLKLNCGFFSGFHSGFFQLR